MKTYLILFMAVATSISAISCDVHPASCPIEIKRMGKQEAEEKYNEMHRAVFELEIKTRSCRNKKHLQFRLTRIKEELFEFQQNIYSKEELQCWRYMNLARDIRFYQSSLEAECPEKFRPINGHERFRNDSFH